MIFFTPPLTRPNFNWHVGHPFANHRRAMGADRDKFSKGGRSQAWSGSGLEEHRNNTPQPHARLLTEEEKDLLKRCTDHEVAVKLGCSTATVKRVRREFGIRKARSGRPWTAEEEALLGTMPDEELAKRLGRTKVAIQARRILFKIPKFDGKLHQWTSVEDALLGTVTDVEIASRLGVSIAAVASRRRKLGKAVKFAHRRPWTAVEDALLGTAPDTELAARLGRHVSTVCIRRRKLGILRSRRPN